MSLFSTKSFCNISAFASNAPGVVSALGELTTYGYTFSKEIGQYYHSTLKGYELVNLNSATDGVKQAMSQINVDQAIALVDTVVQTTLGTSGELYYDETLLALKTKGEAIAANTIDIGAMVQANDHWVPEWISWTDATIGADNNTHKVWLSLDAYKNQYTDYEIVVVPPFDDLDSFFNPGSVVEDRIKAITPTQMIERSEIAKAGNPETKQRIDPYEYRDPVNSARRFDVYWTVIIYGPAGDDPDIIREALVAYILANSSHTRDEWAVIFPDIFKRTEYIFAPLWDQYAAEQRVFDYGVYSPIVNNDKPVAWLVQYAAGYVEDHIKAHAQLMSFPYRSMQVAVVGNIENRDGKMDITDYFSDFISVGTESTDFGRMSPNTQAWAMMMMSLIETAESMNASTDLPRGQYRVVRNGVTYLAQSFNRILLLVLVKSNVPAPVTGS